MSPSPETFARSRTTLRDVAVLFLLTCAAILIHGYHPFSEDAEIYVPQIRKLLHPTLYPFNAQFFKSHAHLTLFPDLVATLVRLTHFRLSLILFLCHFASIFLLLLVCKRIAAKCFPSEPGQWAAVAMIAVLLTMPATGTSLYLMDQYFNPRSISTFSILFAVDAALESNFLRAILWLVFTALIHPLMIVFGAFYIVLLVITSRVIAKRRSPAFVPAALAVAAAPSLLHPSPAFFQALHDHPYYFVLGWHWYEWLGIFAPLALLWWFIRIAEKRTRPALNILALSLMTLGLACFLGALIVSIPAVQVLAIGQPMRGFQLLYLLMFLVAGGLIGEAILNKRALLWVALFVPIGAGMAFAQYQIFPSDRHIEWPGAPSTNPWLQAFDWSRANTPEGAIFALNPAYMALPGEDYQGFRAIAARSSLADGVKDWSAAVMFPGSRFADQCLEQIHAAGGWRNFGPADFRRLERTYGVTWVVREKSLPLAGLSCPYQNAAVAVCRIG
jgi:hypothetical protein